MSKPILVDANEHGLVRVFSLSLQPEAAEALKEAGASALQATLGASALDASSIEIFALSDLGDMTLPAYLVEGSGVHSTALDRDRAKLAALEGWVMIVYSSAFEQQGQTLLPSPELTLIGTYPQEGIDWSGDVDLHTPSALPNQDAPPARKRPSDAAMSGRIATLALLVAFGVVALMVWVGS